MSENEFDLIDELYFVQPFQYLRDSLGWQDELIIATLESLHANGYVKCLRSPDEEVFGDLNLVRDGKNFYFLATKKGLMAHNTI